MSQNVPDHPVLHFKQDPFSILHMLSLQLAGHGLSQSMPNTPDLLHPLFKFKKKHKKMLIHFFLRLLGPIILLL